MWFDANLANFFYEEDREEFCRLLRQIVAGIPTELTEDGPATAWVLRLMRGEHPFILDGIEYDLAGELYWSPRGISVVWCRK